MVDQKILRYIPVGFPVLVHKLIPDQPVQAVFEIPQNKLAAFAGKEAQNIVFILLQMLQQMTEHGFRRVSAGIQPVRVLLSAGIV